MTRALIVGAANPIGCRLAEALCERDVSVGALVADWTKAWRLARLPVRMIEGSVAGGETLQRAMEACDSVYHCGEYDGLGSSRRDRKFVEVLLGMAMRVGVDRVICLNAAGVATASERVILRHHREHDLPVTVLRPAMVYGPFCSWTIDAVRALRRGRRLRAGGRLRAGRGRALYVDHLVEAMLLANRCEAAAGGVFPLHDAEPTSRDELFEAHARALDRSRDAAPVSRAATSGEPQNGADMREARLVLGYEPASTFLENMARTAAWIEWARL